MFSHVLNWEQILNDFRLTPRNTFLPDLVSGQIGPQPKNIVIAFSAGADSVATLFFVVQNILHGLTGNSPGRSLTLLFIDHFIDYKEKANERERLLITYTQALHQILGDKFFFVRQKIQVEKLSRKLHSSFERTASQLRHKAYVKQALRNQASVVTGHNLSDWYETVIMRLNRGSAQYAPRLYTEEEMGVTFIRPLVYLTRSEVRDLCEKYRLPFWNDPENDNLSYTRNQIRSAIVEQNSGGLRRSAYLAADTKKKHIHQLRKLESEMVSEIKAGREYHAELNSLEKLAIDDQQTLVMHLLKKIGLYPLRAGLRDALLSGKLQYAPWYCEKENYAHGRFLVVRRGRSRMQLVPSPREGEKCIPAGLLPPGATIQQEYGSKAVKKIFSEYKLSARQRRSVLVYVQYQPELYILRIALSAFGFKDIVAAPRKVPP